MRVSENTRKIWGAITVLVYLLIPCFGPKVGAPLIVVLLFSLFAPLYSDQFVTTIVVAAIVSGLIIAAIIVLLAAIAGITRPYESTIVTVCATVMLVPLFYELANIKSSDINHPLFFGGYAAFIVLTEIWISMLVSKERKLRERQR